MPTRPSSWERPGRVSGPRKSQAGASSASVHRVRGTPHRRGSRRSRWRIHSRATCAASFLAAWAAAASTAGETAAGGAAGGVAAGATGGKSGLAPASRSDREEASHAVGREPRHPLPNSLGAAGPQEAAAGHARGGRARGDLQEGGGALPLIRLGAGVPVAPQLLLLLGSEGNSIHQRLSLANSEGLYRLTRQLYRILFLFSIKRRSRSPARGPGPAAAGSRRASAPCRTGRAGRPLRRATPRPRPRS